LITLTSNGVLLNDTAVDFLVKNNMHVSVSIDGPEAEHDKFRVTADQKGSWKVIMDNLCRFKKRYPEFYDQKVSFLCTFHPLHDKKAIDEFFLSHEELFNLDKVTFNNVRLDNLDDDVLSDISAKRDKTSISILQFEKNGDKLFTPAKFKVNRLTPKVKLTGTCFPGDRKIFVNTNGDMHLCEAIAESLPIGNVSKGLYFDQIRKIVREFNEEIIKKKCWLCDIWFFCNACFLTALRGEKFDIDCPRELISASLKKRLEFLEKKHEEKLRDLSINSVGDYLEFLR
jgi:uncharacterized protein